MRIVVRKRELYGRIVYYPANPEAEALADIMCSKTLNDVVLRKARDGFGASIEIEPETFA